MSDDSTRRAFLARCGQTACAAAAVSAIPALLGCPTTPDTGDEDPDDEGWLTLALADYPALGAAGGIVLISVDDGATIVAVARTQDEAAGGFAAIDGVCSHLQCDLNSFDTAAQTFGCPCHGSSFDTDGAVLSGPATVDLTAYPTEYDADADAVRVQVA